MREKEIETIWCWLFGHKFVWDARASEYHNPKPTPTDFCVRCGIKREEV